MLEAETFNIQYCLPCALLFDLSTCMLCLVSELIKIAPDLQKFVTDIILGSCCVELVRGNMCPMNWKLDRVEVCKKMLYFFRHIFVVGVGVG